MNYELKIGIEVLEDKNCHKPYGQQTDRQTDSQTDRQRTDFTIYNPSYKVNKIINNI